MILTIIQIIVSVLLIVLIIPQGQGGGLGSTFGSATYHTRRGIEKSVFYLTIIMAVVFTGISIATLLK